MQESFKIKSSSGGYDISLGSNLLEFFLKNHPDTFILIDRNLKGCVPNQFKKVIVIDAFESSKSIENLPNILLEMRKLGANRKTHLLAIGGGIIQDIATFAASVYMRGIKWTYFPTTLLGMVDSCIGGKSSINLAGYKNLIGNFYPPTDIVIDLNFIKTLPKEEIAGGLLEAVKICFARQGDTFEKFISLNPKVSLDLNDTQKVVSMSLKTKKWFIEIDEYDQNERLLLNYGHTFGHAIEAGTNYAISHGIAVGIGMIIANHFALLTNKISNKGLKRLNQLNDYIIDLVGRNLENIMKKAPSLKINDILEKFESDKKHYKDAYRIIVPDHIGNLLIQEIPINQESKALIYSAYIDGLASIGYQSVKQGLS